MCFYKNYDVAELYHMFLVEFYFNQDKSNKGAGIFCFKLYYQTQTPDSIECSHSIDKKQAVFAGPFLFYDPGFFILCHEGFLIIIFVPALENIKDVHVF